MRPLGCGRLRQAGQTPVSRPENGAQLMVDGQMALHEGDAVRARALLEQSRDLAIAEYGENHPIAAMRGLFLSQALHMSGDYKRAGELLMKARQAYDPDVFDPLVSDSFERTLIQVSTMQGHFFVVEEIAHARIERLRALGKARDHDRAVEQDVLAHLFLRQKKFQEAAALLEDSVAIFEAGVGPANKDTGVCYAYLNRAYRELGNYEAAVLYGQKCLQNCQSNLGDDHIETICAVDNLAAVECLLAEQRQDSTIGNEGLARAAAAFKSFVKLEGAEGRSALLCAKNLHSFSRRLANIPGIILPEGPAAAAGVILPNHCFISHSYRDSDVVKKMLGALPKHVKPIVFEPINVAPSDYVSTRLVNAVSSCDAVIVIDAVASNSSFWTAFERNLAARLRKPMVKFTPDTLAFETFDLPEMLMLVAYCCHPKDEAAVLPLIRWLSGAQSFSMINDREAHPKIARPMFGRLNSATREEELGLMRRAGRGVYLVFITSALMADAALRKHVEEQAKNHAHTTIFCWLDRRPGKSLFSGKSALNDLPANHCFEFEAKGPLGPSQANKFDDLMVRIFWVFHQQGLGVPLDQLGRGKADSLH